MSVPQLRRASILEVDEAMTTMGEAFPPDYGEAWNHGQVSGMLSLPGTWLTLARLDDQPAGFALARVVADEAELLLIAVRPPGRRRGVGRALLVSVAEDAAARGAIRLHLEMRANNTALALYSSEGFAEVGRRTAYYSGSDGSRWDAITLSKSLPVI